MLLQVQSLSDASNKLKHTILKEKKVDIEILGRSEVRIIELRPWFPLLIEPI